MNRGYAVDPSSERKVSNSGDDLRFLSIVFTGESSDRQLSAMRATPWDASAILGREKVIVEAPPDGATGRVTKRSKRLPVYFSTAEVLCRHRTLKFNGKKI